MLWPIKQVFCRPFSLSLKNIKNPSLSAILGVSECNMTRSINVNNSSKSQQTSTLVAVFQYIVVDTFASSVVRHHFLPPTCKQGKKDFLFLFRNKRATRTKERAF